mgnify:CR=1 FL=1
MHECADKAQDAAMASKIGITTEKRVTSCSNGTTKISSIIKVETTDTKTRNGPILERTSLLNLLIFLYKTKTQNWPF